MISRAWIAALAFSVIPSVASAQVDTTLPAPAPVPAPDPAFAAAADAGVVPGATVYDLQGNTVGQVMSVNGENVVVHTGTATATLAKSGFARSNIGPVIGMNRAQLDQAIVNVRKETEAKLATALVAGANVHSSDGVLVGPITEFDASGNVVIQRLAGPIALPRSQFTADGNGGPMLRFTAAQLEAAIALQAPPAPLPAQS